MAAVCLATTVTLMMATRKDDDDGVSGDANYGDANAAVYVDAGHTCDGAAHADGALIRLALQRARQLQNAAGAHD